MRKLAAALLLLCALAVVGVRAGWFFQGFSPAELEQLERDWEQVVAWADMPEVEPEVEPRLAQLKRDLQSAELPDGLFDQGRGEYLSREQLTPEQDALLSRWETLLAEGRFGSIPADEPVLGLMQLGLLELRMDDLDAQRMGQFLAWTRSLQRGGTLIHLVAGASLGTQALERCRAEPALRPAMVSASPPTVNEFFVGLCRDYVLTDRMRSMTSVGAMSLPEDQDSEFVTHALRRAMANNAQRFHPLRNAPEGFGEQPAVEVPGGMSRWAAFTFGQPDVITRYMESFFAPVQAQESWVHFVETWNEVLGT